MSQNTSKVTTTNEISLEPVDVLLQRAAERKGGMEALNTLLAYDYRLDESLSDDVSQQTDDRVLSAFTKKIFQSGFVWRVVENKWLNFEESFFDFNINKVLMMPEEMLERKAADPKIIRNFNKVKTIKTNAEMIFAEQQNGHSFSQFLSAWPKNDIIGLWAYLKKEGARLGGNTGPYALRALGIDTFLLTRDVEAYFRSHELISGGLQSKRSLQTIQDCFNRWQQTSDLSLRQLSCLVAYGTGDNNVQFVQD